MTSPPKAQPTASFMSPSPHSIAPHERHPSAPEVEPNDEASSPQRALNARGDIRGDTRGVRDLFEPAYALLDPESLDLHELMDEEGEFSAGADTGVEELSFEPSAWEDDLLTAEELENLFVSPPNSPPPPLELLQLFEERAHIDPPPQLDAPYDEPPARERPYAPQSLSPRSLSDHPIFTTQETPSLHSSQPPEPTRPSTPERSHLSSTPQLASEHAQTLDEPLEPSHAELSPLSELFEPLEPLEPSPSASALSVSSPSLSSPPDPHPVSVEPPLLAQEQGGAPNIAALVSSADRARVAPPPPTLKRGGVTPPHTRVIALMGAQGGVGTSLIAANLAVCLAKLGERVGLADLNASGSNLHTLLGLEPVISQPSDLLRLTPKPTLHEVRWSDSASSSQSLKGEEHTHSAFGEGELWLAQPATSLMGVSPPEHRLKALERLAQCEATLWVLDLGHHQDALSLTRFHEADVSVVVLEPQLSAIERAHHLTRAALFHNILGHADDASIIARAMLMADHVGELNTPSALLASLERVNPEAAAVMRKRLSAFTPQLLLNKCRTHSDRDLTLDLSAVMKRKWRVSTCPLGAIDYDEHLMKRSLQRAERPLALERVSSPLKSELERLSKRIYKQVRTQETT